MINNIKNNTISEAFAKQKLDALNEIRKVETKNKRLINRQKILLSLSDDLVEAIFDNNRSENKNDNVGVTESVNDNDVNDDVNGDDDYYIIKQLNNYFKAIDETKH